MILTKKEIRNISIVTMLAIISAWFYVTYGRV